MSTATLLASAEPRRGYDGANQPAEAELAALLDHHVSCGCLLTNVQNLGHRPDCDNYFPGGGR